MGNLRYASVGSDRLWDAIEERYFITEKLAVEKMNEALERAARMVDAAMEPDTMQGVNGARIRALKEKV